MPLALAVELAATLLFLAVELADVPLALAVEVATMLSDSARPGGANGQSSRGWKPDNSAIPSLHFALWGSWLAGLLGRIGEQSSTIYDVRTTCAARRTTTR